MPTRRSFMWLPVVGTAAATHTKWVSHALAQESDQRGGAMGIRPLPTSIAALQSMTSQVQPITNYERLVRIEKAKKLME